MAVSWCLRGMHPIRQPKTPWSPDIFKAGLITDWVKENALFWLHLADADQIMRYESLDADLSAVLGEPVKVPEHNVTPGRNGRHYSEFYSPEAIKYIGERFAEEIDELGYKFENAGLANVHMCVL